MPTLERLSVSDGSNTGRQVVHTTLLSTQRNCWAEAWTRVPWSHASLIPASASIGGDITSPPEEVALPASCCVSCSRRMLWSWLVLSSSRVGAEPSQEEAAEAHAPPGKGFNMVFEVHLGFIHTH